MTSLSQYLCLVQKLEIGEMGRARWRELVETIPEEDVDFGCWFLAEG
jgi:hypothetical protein